MADATHRTEIGGTLRLDRATVLDAVALYGLKTGGDLDMHFATMDGEVVCRPQAEHRIEIGGIVNLQGCRARRVELDGRLCNARPVRLALAQIADVEITQCLPQAVYLEGMQFQKLTLPQHKSYTDFLAATQPFRRSSYILLERWLKNQGEEEHAKRIYLAMRRRERREGKRGISYVGDWLLDVITGYGVRSERLFWYLLLMIILSAWLFSHPHALVREPAKSASEATALQDNQSQRPVPTQPTPADAFWAAMQVTLPVISMKAVDKWQPSSAPVTVSRWPLFFSYQSYASFVSLVNWILVPLFLASITGILRRQDGNPR